MLQRNLPILFFFGSCESCQFLPLKVNRVTHNVFVIFKFSQKKGLPGLCLLFSELFICQSEMTSFSWHFKLSIVSSYLTSIRLIIFQCAVFTSYMSVSCPWKSSSLGTQYMKALPWPFTSLQSSVTKGRMTDFFSSIVVVFCTVSIKFHIWSLVWLAEFFKMSYLKNQNWKMGQGCPCKCVQLSFQCYSALTNIVFYNGLLLLPSCLQAVVQSNLTCTALDYSANKIPIAASSKLSVAEASIFSPWL